MFEWAESSKQITPADYDEQVAKLRMDLLDAQYDLLENAKFPVILLISGVDGAGKGETVNALNEWMDPRHILTKAFSDPTEEEKARPHLYRYWKALPPKGKMGILFGSWYTGPILRRTEKKENEAQFDQYLEEINSLEKMLVHEGALVIKLWFHLSKKQQRKRLEALEKNPKTRWRVTAGEWERFAQYDNYRKHSEHALSKTSTPEAPWSIIDGSNPEMRLLTVGKLLLKSIRNRLDNPAPVFSTPAFPTIVDGKNPLKKLDYAKKLAKSKYEKELERWSGKLNLLSRSPDFQKKSVVLVFEGTDAAGKGSTIRRITRALDARHYNVVPVAAPTEEERKFSYLWRFWRQLPKRGRFTIFDRSWYGRVLVERVEKFCSETEWQRAYSEINEFEEQMRDSNILVIKFYLSITPEEQLNRFNARKTIGFKRFKITDEDWRNREKAPAYEIAVNDMLRKTGTIHAPWNLIEANDKYFARIKVLKTICKEIERALK